MSHKMDIHIIPYQESYKDDWDRYVESSKNGTFLFKRDYMDYHSDRFTDNSYMIYNKGRLYSLLPACKIQDSLVSHGGLTYGGLIMDSGVTAEGVLAIFDIICRELKEKGFRNFIYKPIPHIYHKLPAEEDLYALFRHNAVLTIRNISSTIQTDKQLKLSTLRRRMVSKARENGILVEKSEDWARFWHILESNLWERHRVKPVHSLKEITSLKDKFPEIQLYAALGNGIMMGGIVCYLTPTVLHLQYIAANPEGKKMGAIDAIVNYLLENNCLGKPYLDMGISNEERGWYLNEGLISQKEGFGGRGICYDTYDILL